jgi:DNA-binding NarL/FixJ family response regulator
VGRCIIILSGQLLFAEGVANRIRQYLPGVEIAIINARQPDALVQVAAVQPAVVLLDVTDPEITRLGCLDELLLSLPGLKVIRLDPQHEQIQVVISEQRTAGAVRDLIEAIAWST